MTTSVELNIGSIRFHPQDSLSLPSCLKLIITLSLFYFIQSLPINNTWSDSKCDYNCEFNFLSTTIIIIKFYYYLTAPDGRDGGTSSHLAPAPLAQLIDKISELWRICYSRYDGVDHLRARHQTPPPSLLCFLQFQRWHNLLRVFNTKLFIHTYPFIIIIIKDLFTINSKIVLLESQIWFFILKRIKCNK